MVGRNRTRFLSLVAGLLIMMAVPSIAADPTREVGTGPGVVDPDPIDAVWEAVNLTLAYVEDFNPNDNATTMKEKSEQFLADVTELLMDLFCTKFKIGVGLPSIDPTSLSDGYAKMKIPAWGYDKEADKEGVGMMTIQVGLDVSCTSLISEPDPPVRTDSIPLDAAPEVLQSAARNFRFLLPALS